MRRTNLYLDQEKLRALKMLAADEDVSVSDLVREAIDTMIGQRLIKNASKDHRAATTLDNVLRRVDGKRPPVSQDETDRDVAEAVAESRSDRVNRRRRSPSVMHDENG